MRNLTLRSFAALSTGFSGRLKHYRLLLVMLFCMIGNSTFAAVTVVPGSGGTNICSDLAMGSVTPGYTTLGAIQIVENVNNDLATGADILTIDAPAGWEFNPASPIGFTTLGGGFAGTPIVLSISSTSLTIQINMASTATADALFINGLEVQATSTASAAGIVNASAAIGIAGVVTGTGGTVFANLALTPSPTVITGPSSVCPAFTVTLGNTVAGGTWTNVNPLVTSVGSTTGVVTGVAPGNDTITYTLPSGCAVTTTIDVYPAPTPIMATDTTICVGEYVTVSDSTVGGVWSSANGFVTVSSIGGVTGITAGVDTISYTLGCAAIFTMTIDPIPTPIIGPPALCVGTSHTLSDATPGGIWSSSVPGAADIGSATGIVTGYASGGTIISYTNPANGCAATIFFLVRTPPAAIGGSPAVCEGSAMLMTNAIPGGTWSNTMPAISSITSFGLVSGTIPGLDTIVYTIAGCAPVTYPITVNPLPAVITGPTSICIGLATVLSDASPGGMWSSSDTLVATVSPTGVITPTTGVIGSSATIIYTLPTSCFVTAVVTVNAPPAPIVGADSICQGAITTMTNITPGGIWSSTDLSRAAIVDSSGVLTGVSGGTVNISYSLGNGCATYKSFVVLPPTPAYVTVTDTPSGTVCAGTPVRYIATTLNAGTPTFNWQIFYSGTLTPDSTSTDTFYYTPQHGDVVICRIVAHGVCAVTDTVSDTLPVNVYPVIGPGSVVITINKAAAPDSVLYLGQVFTFFSNVLYGGTTHTYQWFRNGAPVSGATNSTFSITSYTDEDIFCAIAGNSPCTTDFTDTSNTIHIYGNYLGTNSISSKTSTITLFPNPNTGSFTLNGNVGLASDAVALEVSDMLGHIVYKGIANPVNGTISKEIELDNVANGNYLLRLNSTTDNQVFHFVISK